MNAYEFSTFQLGQMISLSIAEIMAKYNISEDNARYIKAFAKSIA
jgi:hypothetical protein